MNDSNHLWNSRTYFNICPTYSLHFQTFLEINLRGTSNPLKFLLLYLYCLTWIWGVPLIFWTHSLHSLSLSSAVFVGIRQMNLLPPSLVLQIDVTSRLSGMCTCITLGRQQVEEMAGAIFVGFPQSLYINKSIMLQTSPRPFFRLSFQTVIH